MNPFLSKEIAQLHIAELRRAARKERVATAEFDDEESRLVVRAFRERDIDAVRLLAALEGGHLPTGPVLVAEVDDEVVAALPLDGGRPLADPFRPTAHVVALLELRARQLRDGAVAKHAPLLKRLRGAVRAA
jgi:hypothetical protein